MIIPIYFEKDTYLHPKDENKLLLIENKENIIFAEKSHYNNITILNASIGRILLFDDTYQGGIIHYQGFDGGMPYTRYYHLAGIINNNIKDILVLGLGSGSVIHDCLNIYNYNKIDAVEIDPAIVDLAYKYFELPKTKGLIIHCCDARDFVFNCKKTYDLIIIDLFLAEGMPLTFMAYEFIEQVYKLLNPDGVAGVNLFGSETLSEDFNDIFKSEYKTYAEFFDSLYIFPVLYGGYEFFRYCCDLRYRMGKLTNVVLLSSKSKKVLKKNDLIARAKQLKETTKFKYLKNIDLYARDYYDRPMNTESLKTIKDNLKASGDFDSFLDIIKK